MRGRIVVCFLIASATLSADTLAVFQITSGTVSLDEDRILIGGGPTLGDVSGPGFVLDLGPAGDSNGSSLESCVPCPLPATSGLGLVGGYAFSVEPRQFGGLPFFQPDVWDILWGWTIQIDTPSFRITPGGPSTFRVPFEGELLVHLARIEFVNGSPVMLPGDVLFRGGGIATASGEFFALEPDGPLDHFLFTSVEYQFVPIPEPGTLTVAFGLAGMLALTVIRKRHNPNLPSATARPSPRISTAA